MTDGTSSHEHTAAIGRASDASLARIEAEARGEIEWLEARQRRNLEVRERLKWIRRCLRLIEELREARGACIVDVDGRVMHADRSKIGVPDEGRPASGFFI